MTAFDVLEVAHDYGLSVVQYADNMPLGRLGEGDHHRLYEVATEKGIALELGTQCFGADEVSRHIVIGRRLHARITLCRAIMLKAGDAIAGNRDWLSELDGVIGDGDHGITMDIGWTALRKALDAAPGDVTASEPSDRMAKAFLDAVGASSGPLYASAFRSAGAAVSDRLNLDAGAMVAWVAGICEGILARAGAAVGDKTMIDAWVPAKEAAEAALAGGR